MQATASNLVVETGPLKTKTTRGHLLLTNGMRPRTTSTGEHSWLQTTLVLLYKHQQLGPPRSGAKKGGQRLHEKDQKRNRNLRSLDPHLYKYWSRDWNPRASKLMRKRNSGVVRRRQRERRTRRQGTRKCWSHVHRTSTEARPGINWKRRPG